MDRALVRLDGEHLDCAQVSAVARDRVPVEVTDGGMQRARAGRLALDTVLARQPVYGRTTGVGANRSEAVTDGSAPDHGRRLLRSHAGGAGPMVDPVLARAMLVVRLNQLTLGGAGVDPGVLPALRDAVNRGLTPPVRRYGAIGTGDLTALATTALCLLGEREWQGGRASAYPLDDADALAFISSNAATIGEAALAGHDLDALDEVALAVAGLSAVAVGASPEPFADAVQAARPHPGQRIAAARMRSLLGEAWPGGRRIQDPYGFRALPQVHGAAGDAYRRLHDVLGIEMNSAAENPLVDVRAQRVLHNGNFHGGYVGQALDAACAALVPAAALSVARLANLMDPNLTGAPRFLADGPAGSSGLLILEYVAHAALADLRHAGTSAPAGPTVLSLGTEDHASFATQAAHRATTAAGAYPTVLACELVAAVRVLRMAGGQPPEPLRAFYARACDVLDPDTGDRSLEDDIEAATRLVRG